MPLAVDTELAPDSISTLPETLVKTPEELATIVSNFAATDGWLDRVRLRADHRWYERLHLTPDYDIWLISWLPGQSTGYHDHGASSGALIVTTGILEEHLPGELPRVIHPHQPRSFGPDYAHDVRNVSLAPAISIHAYSPPLDEMNEYELDGSDLIPRENSSENTDRFNANPQQSTSRKGTATIDQLLSAARLRLHRLTPTEAASADAILIDIRPEAQRATEGTIPNALIIDRNVLEWRLDPTSATRLPIATSHDLHAIIFCSEGYTSSLAAAALQDLGLHRATDIIGGFAAWRAAGLPTTPPGNA